MGLFDFFKSNSDMTKIDLSDFKFVSNDHIRYQNEQDVSGHNYDCWRDIHVQNNIGGGQGYTVTIYNLDGNHPVWGNDIQMAPKQMKIVEQNNTTIKLRGFGRDPMGNSFADYGLTFFITKNEVEKVSLHMFDRNIEIVYLKASTEKPKITVTLEQIESEFSQGVMAINNSDSMGAAKHFKKALDFKQAGAFVNDDWDSCCYFNFGEALKGQNKYEEAIPNYRKAIEKKKQNEDAYICLAECYFGLETVEGLKNVITTLNSCTLLFPQNETAHYNIGVAYYKLDDKQKALHSFKRSLDLGNEEAKIYVYGLQGQGYIY